MGIFAAVEQGRVRLIARIIWRIADGVAMLRCSVDAKAWHLGEADGRGLRLYCRKCKQDHLLRWPRVHQLESELTGGNRASAYEADSCPLDT